MDDKFIIYLDDDEESVGLIGETLKELNYKVEHVKTTAAAEKMTAKFEPDLFIVSMDIASADPTELIQKIKKNKELKKTPFVFMSANFEEDVFFEEFKDADKKTSRFIRKPFKTEDFVDVVEETIGLPSPPKGVYPIPLDVQRDLINIKKENEELKSEVDSLKGTKSTVAEKAAYIKEIQKDLDKHKKEKYAVEDELGQLKQDLIAKEKEIIAAEKKMSDIRNEKLAETRRISEELAETKKTLSEEKEKHKKAQSALREFYKPKLANLTKLEERVEELEKEKGSMVAEMQKKLEEAEKKLKMEKGLKDKLKKVLEDIEGQ